MSGASGLPCTGKSSRYALALPCRVAWLINLMFLYWDTKRQEPVLNYMCWCHPCCLECKQKQNIDLSILSTLLMHWVPWCLLGCIICDHMLSLVIICDNIWLSDQLRLFLPFETICDLLMWSIYTCAFVTSYCGKTLPLLPGYHCWQVKTIWCQRFCVLFVLKFALPPFSAPLKWKFQNETDTTFDIINT